MFRLGKKSLQRLRGVKPELVNVVRSAIVYTGVDFGVTCGLRSLDEQRELVERGASQTMKSKHLKQPDGWGHAVDLVAYLGSRISWELSLYDDIGEAVRAAGRLHGVRLRWGAAWHIDNICAYGGKMEAAMNEYVDLRRSQGRRPFIDAPHWELSS